MSRRRAFTLVELLVVIGIIVCLVAILLPVVQGVRQRALILVCPIAYVGQDYRVHLTDPSGSYDFVLTGRNTISQMGVSGEVVQGDFGGRVAWSPSGRSIACHLAEKTDVKSAKVYVAVIDPATKRVKKHPATESGDFAEWRDSDSFIEIIKNPEQRKKFDVPNQAAVIRDAESGAVREIVPVAQSRSDLHIARMPVNAGWYVSADAGRLEDGVMKSIVRLRRRDFGPGKIIWQDVGEGGGPHNWGPVVDPLGEYVAWTRFPKGGSWFVAIKRIKDGASVAPQLLGKEYAWATFCDWTENGNLLVTLPQDQSGSPTTPATLAIMDKMGRLVQKIPTAVPPCKIGATWRKYGHQ